MGTRIRWWIKILSISCVSLFFLAFGIQTLLDAYSLTNPFEFLMYFFSSTLIILISIVGIIYPVLRVHSLFKSNTTD